MASCQLEVIVYDRRSGNKPEVALKFNDADDFKIFQSKIRQEFNIAPTDPLVVCTTNREPITDDATFKELDDGDTVYLLTDLKQDLPAQTKQRVHYLPHYDTLVKSGMYEYYASEGQNPLPYAFAELIDNSLAATATNVGPRHIELRLMLEDSNSTIVVLDNGRGMSSRQLNNWAIYRLSKFIRKDKVIRTGGPSLPDVKSQSSLGESDEESGHQNSSFNYFNYMPRSLNSEISYFGVGGKQAIFFIGNSTRMITKPKESCDVHELVISKDEFERKEKQKESIYSGFIRNRQPGDATHVNAEDEHVKKIILEEKGKDSFTCVVIQGISQSHVQYFKYNFHAICRQLVHIYHYYIHGPHGNLMNQESLRIPSPFRNIDIEVKMYVKGQNPKIVNLREIGDDLESQFIHSGANSFEFKAVVEGTGVVEGILRYHPFLYDRETFPTESSDLKAVDTEDDHDYANSDTRPARGRRSIFECFWNGRLIPYTSIDEFDWCSTPKKSKNIPLDCYNRVSGVLWTNDKFQVSTNKLTFMDLEVRLRDKNTVFCRVLNGQEKRGNIDKQFTDWLKECHENCDKQIKFSSFKGIVMRTELPRNKQHPWAVFDSIEWDGKIFKKGQLVRFQRTIPIMHGAIRRFLLYGDYNGEVFATGGEIEITQEPQSLYDEVKVLPLTKLDRSASEATIRKWIEEEEGKLPEKLVVTWPEGDELSPNEKRPAGKTIGAIKVEIANRKGELISKLPGSNQKKLLIELKVVWHSPSGDQTIVNHLCQHAKNWPYWFRKMENVKNLGPHTLQLQALVNESGGSSYAGKDLPSYKLKFTIIEAEPERFTVGLLDGPFRVGTPFQIPLEFQDKFGNSTKPNAKIKPEVKASGLELQYDGTQIRGNALLIKGIIAKGIVETNAGKNFSLVVSIPGLEDNSQTLKIRLLPGPPSQLLVTPTDDVLEVENGSSLALSVRIQDVSGNCTAEPRLVVTCKFIGGQHNLPTYVADCSASGQASLTGEPIHLKRAKGTENIKAKIEVQNRRDIPAVEKTVVVLPSSRAACLKLSYENEMGDRTTIDKDKEMTCVAGSILQSLEFKVLDEGGRSLDLTSSQLSRLKANWIPNVNKDMLLAGRLPDIKVPLSIKETKYCNLTIGDDVDFGFTIKVKTGEPSSIKCSCTGSNKIRMGEALQADVLVAVADKHGNPVKKLPLSALGSLEITGDDLVTEHLVRALGQSGGFVIKGVFFDGGKLGSRELCIRWRGLTDYVRLQMVAGPPTQISLPGFDVTEPLTVYNNCQLERPLVVQLCDKAGNPCNEGNIKIQLGIDEGLKLTPAPQPSKSDQHGRTSFGKVTVSARSSHVHPTCPGGLCGRNCHGIFAICPKAFCGRTIITGALLKVHIPSDPCKAVEMQIEYDKSATYTVDEILTEFKVYIMAEDGSIMDAVKPSEVCMKMWKAEGLQSKPPAKAITYAPSHVNKNDEPGIFSFRDRRIPETSGTHNILFVYESGNVSLSSNIIAINVMPARPVRLAPFQNLGMPTVSNTPKVASRTLFKSLKLELRDKYGNPSGQNLNGKLVLQVTSETNPDELPQLLGGVTSMEVPLQKGQCILQNITIEEDTPGNDGEEYLLRCSAQIPDLPRNHSIPPFDIAFLFYNDVKKQAQMASLSKERDHLLGAIKSLKSVFEANHQLINELKLTVRTVAEEEQKLKMDLRKLNVPGSQLSSPESIKKVIKTRKDEQDRLQHTPRRQCGLTQAPRDPDVLGKIAHLALCDDSDIAQVLSWHMSADMDCIVTHKMAKAREIYHKTKGTQQVLALDSLYKRNLPDWNKPLPHLKVKSSYRPTGNPMYARDLLIFPSEAENCKLVFGMLLGDTIILDTLDDATKYRQEVVKFAYCPTLLTRRGDRIRSNGKFGGQQNRAPPIEKLRGAVFGEPFPEEFNTIGTVIDTLETFLDTVHRHQHALAELQEQLDQERSPSMQEKMRECQEAEEQLRDIESKLGMSSSKSPTSRSRIGTRGVAVNLPPELTRSTGKRGRSAATSDEVSASPSLRADVEMDSPSTPSNSTNGMATRFRSTPSPSIRGRRGTDSPGRYDDRKRRKT